MMKNRHIVKSKLHANPVFVKLEKPRQPDVIDLNNKKLVMLRRNMAVTLTVVLGGRDEQSRSDATTPTNYR
jgi:hypothetical protein